MQSIDTTAAAMNSPTPRPPAPPGVRPAAAPVCSSTNANSPTCAVSSPAAPATPQRAPASLTPAAVTAAFTTSSASTQPSTGSGFCHRNAGSSRMPTLAKNTAEKSTCSGSTSPKAWWLKRLSEMSSPARKAPSARLTPASEVTYASPKHTATSVSRNTSAEQVRATFSISGGTSRRAPSSTSATMPPALASAHRRPSAPPPPAAYCLASPCSGSDASPTATAARCGSSSCSRVGSTGARTANT